MTSLLKSSGYFTMLTDHQGNNVALVDSTDPTGCDTIYTAMKDRLESIGFTNGDDPNKYLVSRKMAKSIREKTAAGESISSMENSQDVAILPTADLMEAVLQSVEDAKKSFLEQGGHMESDGQIKCWDAGSPYDIEEHKKSISPFQVNGSKILDMTSASYWHVHAPSGPQEPIGSGSAMNSLADGKTDCIMRGNGFNGTAFVVGARTRNVTFYYQYNRIGIVRLSELLRITK